ncbi:hypothetical protein LOCC1_G006463 [Lachnellula occidentalis]|uniref:Uncharacterized protein n=1 Tax=Lachnellula occidentalis TaxID=215460 RepID=A0A8H8S343_9HELO|nr:hypothetical protein LOCC1_G006463 [Lachnellula occidentalis]
MNKIIVAFGLLALSNAFIAAQSISAPQTKTNLSIVTSTTSSEKVTSAPFGFTNSTSSAFSNSSYLVSSGIQSIMSTSVANNAPTRPRPTIASSRSIATKSGTSSSSQIGSDISNFTNGPGVSSQTTSLSFDVATVANTPNTSHARTISSGGLSSTISGVLKSESTVTRSSAFSTSIFIPGTGILPFPTTTFSSSFSVTSTPAFTFIGSWGDSSSPSPVSFTWFDIPTGTISDAAAQTSEAVLLGGIFFALHANRKWVTDPKLKSQYLDSIKKTQQETIALLDSLPVNPPSVPDCSMTKKKRDALSEVQLRALLHDRSIIPDIGKFIKGAIDDVGKLIGCAGDVVKNLASSGEGSTPDLGEIENLTDTLAEIGKDLEEKKGDDPSSTSGESSSTLQSSSSSPSSSSSSSSSCTGSTAVPICTQTISLSTSFMLGGTSSSVATITQTNCITSTVAGCSGAGTTATVTTASTSSSSLYSIDQELEPYSTDSGAAQTSLASQIMAEHHLGNLGCVGVWDLPTPCDLRGLNSTNPSSAVDIPSPVLSIPVNSSASATRPISIPFQSSVPGTVSTLVSPSSFVGPNSTISGSSTIAISSTLVTSISIAGKNSMRLSSASVTRSNSTSLLVSISNVPSTLVTRTSDMSLPTDIPQTSSANSFTNRRSSASSSLTNSIKSKSTSSETLPRTSITTTARITPSPAAPTPSTTPPNCRGVNNPNWISRYNMAEGIRDFCTYAGAKNQHDPNSGSLGVNYWPKIDDATNFWIDWPSGVSLQQTECVRNMNMIMDGCDGGPANPLNWKHGGTITYGQFTYHIEPIFDRGYRPGHCSTQFKAYKPDSTKSGWVLADLTAKDNAQVPKILPANKFFIDNTGSENLVNFDAQGKPGPNPFYANLSTTVSGSGDKSEVQFSLGAQAWSLENEAFCREHNKIERLV